MAKYSTGTQKFSLDVSKFVAKVERNKQRAFRKIVIDLFSQIIMRTPVDTGFARANWLPSINSPRMDVLQNSFDKGPVNAKGEGLSLSKTNMIGFFNAQKFDKETVAYLTNSIDYIIPLEYGHSKNQAPNGMVRLTVNKFNDIVNTVAKEIGSQNG